MKLAAIVMRGVKTMHKNKRNLLIILCLGLIPILSGCETTPYEFCGKIEHQNQPECAGNHTPQLPPN